MLTGRVRGGAGVLASWASLGGGDDRSIIAGYGSRGNRFFSVAHKKGQHQPSNDATPGK